METFLRELLQLPASRRTLKRADKVPHTYDRHSFSLDGLMDMDISFGGRTMCTPVYLKMNAHDPLLLSEGVCHQLGILKYHPDVKPREEMPGLEDSKPDSATEVPVPMVCVQLVKSTKVLPQQSTAVSVKLHGCWSSTGLGVLEADLQLGISGLCMEPSLMEVVQDEAQVIVTNPTGFTQRLEQGFHLGTLEKAKVVFDPAWVGEEVAPIQRITTNKSRTIGEEKRSASYFRMLYPYQRRRANFWHFSWTTTKLSYWRWVRGVRQRWWSLKSTLVILPPRSSAHTACLLSGKKVVQPELFSHQTPHGQVQLCLFVRRTVCTSSAWTTGD